MRASLQEEGRLDEAMAQYQAAARLQPDSAAARLDMGAVHEQRGDLDEAEAAFREALRLQPSYALPHARLGTLLRDKLPDADREALETRLADPDLADGPRARLLFALAHVLDARGDYSRAADCLRRANALTLEQARPHRKYQPADHERFVGGLIQAFDRDFFARTAEAGSPSRRPVFIVGMPRSGTTLVEQVLASHPEVYGAGELRLARQSFEAIPAALGRPGSPLECVSDLDASALLRLAEHHLGRLDALAPAGVARIVDKMPDNYLYLGLLATLFPDATFIHCLRDPRDVAVSCWMTDFRSIRWANDLGHLAARFGQYDRLSAHWRQVLPTTVVEVRYEETVADLEGVARRLLEACGLEWDPSCLEFHRARRTVRTASVAQVRRPLYQRSVARWRNYEGALDEFFEALRCDEVALFG